MKCVAEIIEKIRNLDPPCPTTHLISIGGWNAPHPVTTHSTEEMYSAWVTWNTHTITCSERGFYGTLRSSTVRFIQYITLLYGTVQYGSLKYM